MTIPEDILRDQEILSRSPEETFQFATEEADEGFPREGITETEAPEPEIQPAARDTSSIAQDILDDPNVFDQESIAEEMFQDSEMFDVPVGTPKDDFNFLGVLTEEAIRTGATNLFGDVFFGDELESAIGDIGTEKPGITSGVASGFGQAVGDLGTIGAFAGGGFLIAGPPGAATGAAVGTAVTFGQGMRREITDVWSEVRNRGGTRGDAFYASALATPGTIAGEMLDLVKFGRIVPKRFRTNLLGASFEVASDVAGEAVERLGRIKRIITGGVRGAKAEFASEVIQSVSQRGAVEVAIKKRSPLAFPIEVAKAIPTIETLESGIIGAIVGGGTRATVQGGIETLDSIRNKDLQNDVDVATIEVAQAITEIQDPDTPTEAVNIAPEVASPSQLNQIIEVEEGLEIQVANDGSTNLIKEGTRVEVPVETETKEPAKETKETKKEEPAKVADLTDPDLLKIIEESQIPFEEDITLTLEESISRSVDFLEIAPLTSNEQTRLDTLRELEDKELAATNLETLRDSVISRVENEVAKETEVLTPEEVKPLEEMTKEELNARREELNADIESVIGPIIESDNFPPAVTPARRSQLILDLGLENKADESSRLELERQRRIFSPEKIKNLFGLDPGEQLPGLRERMSKINLQIVIDQLREDFPVGIETTLEESTEQGVLPAPSMQDILQTDLDTDTEARRQIEIAKQNKQQIRKPPPGIDAAEFNKPIDTDPKSQKELEFKDDSAEKNSKLPDKGEALNAAHVSLFKTQTLAQRIVADPTLDPVTRLPFEPLEETGESLFQYIPATNIETKREAREHIEKNGFDAVFDSWVLENDKLDLLQQSSLGVELMSVLTEKIKSAEKAGDAVLAEEFRNKQKEIALKAVDFGTDLGQATQYLIMFKKADSPKQVAELYIKAAQRVSEKSGKKKFTELPAETLQKVEELSDLLMSAPDNSTESRKIQQAILSEIAAIQLSTYNVLEAIWYANILSGFNTQAINLFGSGSNLFLRTLSTGLTDPRGFIPMINGMIKAQPKALGEALAAFQGEDVSRSMSKIGAPGALEIILKKKTIDPETVSDRLKNVGIDAVALGRFVFRALAAGDAYFFKTGKEAQAYYVASRMVREQGDPKNAQEFSNAISETLNNSEASYKEALGQATLELENIYTTEELANINKDRRARRRAFEIIEQSRPELVEAESQRFGQITTFTQTPEGTLGVLVNAANLIANAKFGDNSRPFKFLIPFTNIVGNVVSSSLDFTPIGAVRAYRGKNLITDPKNRIEFSDIERRQRLGASIVGTTLTMIVAAEAEKFLDPEDPFPQFAIYAGGPEFGTREQQTFQNIGGKPFTIKLGDKWFKYSETPLAPMLSIIGGMHDTQRFKKAFNKKNMFEKVTYATTVALSGVMEQSFLKGIAGIIEAINNPERRDLGQIFQNISKGFTPAQGLLRDFAKITDPTVIDRKENIWAAYMADIPYAQRIGTRPRLNIFGEPIVIDPLGRTPVISRIVSRRSADPVWKWLADNDLGLPRTPKTITLSVGRSRKSELAEIKEARLKTLGRFAYDVFTPEENYEFVQIRGPILKEAIRNIMLDSRVKDKEEIQEEIDKEKKRIDRDVKLGMVDKMFEELSDL